MVHGTIGRMRRKSGLETAAHRDGTSQSLLQLGSLLMEFPFVRKYSTRYEEQQGPRRSRNGIGSRHAFFLRICIFAITFYDGATSRGCAHADLQESRSGRLHTPINSDAALEFVHTPPTLRILVAKRMFAPLPALLRTASRGRAHASDEHTT